MRTCEAVQLTSWPYLSGRHHHLSNLELTGYYILRYEFDLSSISMVVLAESGTIPVGFALALWTAVRKLMLSG